MGLFNFFVTALAAITAIAVAVGIPSLAFVAVRFLKFKERELTAEIESRYNLQQHVLELEQRVERLENAPLGLEQNVGLPTGSDQPAPAHARSLVPSSD